MPPAAARINDADIPGELEKLHPDSFSWALACCRRDRDEAADVLQSSYLKVLEGRARFAGASSFKTFFFGVIVRTAAEHRRRRWLGALRLDRWKRAGAPALPRDPEQDAMRSSQADRLLRALVRLPRRQRETLELVFSHDLTIEEAAAALGISVGSARVHYHRGKKRLAELLDE